MNREPAMIAAGIAQLISLVIPMLVLFNLVHWSVEQTAGFMAVVNFAAQFAAALFTRSNTVSMPTANMQIKEALKAESTTPVQTIIEKVEAKNA